MVARFVKYVVKGHDFDIASDTDLAQYVTVDTEYKSSDDSVATWKDGEEGVITAVSAGRAILTAMVNEEDGVEINFYTLGIDVDYEKSGAYPVYESDELVGYKVDFEDEAEIYFSAVTPNHIIRTTVTGTDAASIDVDQPSDTSVIVSTRSKTLVEGTVTLDLIDRHSQYVGVIYDLPVSEQYTNIYGETVTKTYSEEKEERGIKIWDDTNKCYRYITTDVNPDGPSDENEHDHWFWKQTPLDATKFYQSVYNTSVMVSGVKLPDTVKLTISNYYNITSLTSAGSTGTIGIDTVATPNVTTDSVRLESWPMNLEFRANGNKDGFVFDLNSAIPYNYKLKSFYKNVITQEKEVKVLGDRLIISNKPVITNETTRTKAYVVNQGEVSSIEFYSNPVRDKNNISYEASDEAVELFNVGTVKLARFTEVGDYTITASYDDGTGTKTTIATIDVTVVGDADSDDREDQDPKNDVKVTFNSNGGSKVNAEGYIITDAGSKISKPKSKKSGYKLDGWYTDAELTTAWDFSDEVTEDMTLYAKWNITTYNITYKNVVSTEHSNPATYTIETGTISLGDATRSGYTFGGWFSNSGLTTEVTEIVSGSTGDKTLYAKWTEQ